MRMEIFKMYFEIEDVVERTIKQEIVLMKLAGVLKNTVDNIHSSGSLNFVNGDSRKGQLKTFRNEVEYLFAKMKDTLRRIDAEKETIHSCLTTYENIVGIMLDDPPLPF